MASQGRSTTIRDRHRAVIRRGEPPCALCHEPIDYTLPHLNPGEFTVDHIVPLDSASTDEERRALDVLANKQPAHRKCNRDKWNKTEGASTAPRSFVTARTW